MKKEEGQIINTRKLEKQELKERQDVATLVVKQLLLDNADHWSSWITAAYIYGSTARGETRADSDVDIAFVSQIKFLTVEDSKNMSALMEQTLEKMMEKFKIVNKFRIHPNFIYKDWLCETSKANITFPELVENVKKEGIKIL